MRGHEEQHSAQLSGIHEVVGNSGQLQGKFRAIVDVQPPLEQVGEAFMPDVLGANGAEYVAVRLLGSNAISTVFQLDSTAEASFSAVQTVFELLRERIEDLANDPVRALTMPEEFLF